MRKLIFLALFVALAAPIAALADGTPPTPATTANQTCKQARTTLGATTFAQTYGSNSSRGNGSAANAYGKCVSQAVATSVNNQVKAIANAARSCKAARKSDAAGFAGKYGTGRNAF